MIDKIKNLIHKLCRPSGISTTLFQLLLPLALYLGFKENASAVWWFGSFLCFTLIYSMIGNNIGMHRYFTHGQFTVHPIIEYLLLWLGCMIMVGSPTSYAVTHLVHHRYPDTELDPHGPGRGWKSLLIYFHRTANLTETKIFSKHIANLTKRYGWVHDYYAALVIINACIVYMISYKVFLFLWFIPCTIVCWGIAYTVIIQHWGNTPVNSKINTYILVCEGLHKNHHLDPMRPNTAMNPGEIDYIFHLTKIFRPKYIERRRKND